MSILSLLGTFRIDENTIKALYLHKKDNQEFLVEWSNDYPDDCEIGYRLQVKCISHSESFNRVVEEAIRKNTCYEVVEGERESEGGGHLYLALTTAFAKYYCEQLK